MESNASQSEDVLDPPEDVYSVKEPVAAMGEAEDAQAEGQEFLKNQRPHLEEEYFFLKSRGKTNTNFLLLWCIMPEY